MNHYVAKTIGILQKLPIYGLMARNAIFDADSKISHAVSNAPTRLHDFYQPIVPDYIHMDILQLKAQVMSAFNAANAADLLYGAEKVDQKEALMALLGPGTHLEKLPQLFKRDEKKESAPYSPRLSLSGNVGDWYKEAREKLTESGYQLFVDAMLNQTDGAVIRHSGHYYQATNRGIKEVKAETAENTHRETNWYRVIMTALGPGIFACVVPGLAAIANAPTPTYTPPPTQPANMPAVFVQAQSTPLATPTIIVPTATQLPIYTLNTSHAVAMFTNTSPQWTGFTNADIARLVNNPEVCFKGYQVPGMGDGTSANFFIANGTSGILLEQINAALSVSGRAPVSLDSLTVAFDTTCVVPGNPGMVHPRWTVNSENAAVLVAIVDNLGKLNPNMGWAEVYRAQQGRNEGKSYAGNYIPVTDPNGTIQWVEVDMLSRMLQNPNGPGLGRADTWILFQHDPNVAIQPDFMNNPSAVPESFADMYLRALFDASTIARIKAGNLAGIDFNDMLLKMSEGIDIGFTPQMDLDLAGILDYANAHHSIATTQNGIAFFDGSAFGIRRLAPFQNAAINCWPFEGPWQKDGKYPETPPGYHPVQDSVNQPWVADAADKANGADPANRGRIVACMESTITVTSETEITPPDNPPSDDRVIDDGTGTPIDP
ncbi:MAG: hypothetical protein ABIJ34_08505 [archaeon]